MERPSAGLLAIVVVWFVLVAGPAALASVNLPLHHWAYEAIERLTAMGIIDRAMVVAKPYSRKLAAKYVARALERIRAGDVAADGTEAQAEPLLDRLLQEFRPELVSLGAVPAPSTAARNGVVRVGARVQIEGDAFFVGGGQTVRLRENRMGQYYANGEQVQSDLRGWVELGELLAVSMDPKYISNVRALGIGATANDKNVYFQELNAKLTLFNIAVQVGRGSNWWGPGYRGTLLLSDHAFPLDMVQVGSDEPFKLPWVFKSLGEWRIHTFLTQLERNRDFPRAKVFGLRISYLPVDWLEVGLTRLTQFDGRGRNQSFPRTVIDAYTNPPNQPGDQDVNEESLIDFRARIPHVDYVVPFPAGFQFYGELGSEDKWSQFPLPSRGAFLVGAYIPQVFRGDTLDFRVEYADTDIERRRHPELANIWYNNGTYVSGMRFRGYPLGHWMGTDATDLFVRATRSLTETVRVGLNFELSERGRGFPVHEKKVEGGMDVTWWVSQHVQFTITYARQRIRNPGQITGITPFVETFASGVVANNHLLWTNLAIEF
ncbi:capsule assembly Wzi family protein [Nitrospira sp. Kam-Ns4a]